MDHTGSTALWNGQEPVTEKSTQILIRDFPHRALAIVSSNHALILRHSQTSSTNSDTSASRCIVEFTPVSRQTLADYRPLTPRPIYGTLGLITVGHDVFLCVITHASRVATIRPGETVERILGVEFFCLNSAEYDNVFSLEQFGLESDAGAAYGQNLTRRDIPLEHPCQELQKLLGNGSFYYSTDFDVTNRLQDRSADSSTFDIDNFDESFLWNSYMIKPLVDFRSRLQAHERDVLDASRILTSAIRGFCLTIAIPQSSAPLRSARSGLPSYLTVISRLSCRRAGTRFNSRGIDDDGNVANFVETETIYWSPSGVIFSYAQVRGSVPVFWEQSPGLIPGQQKITITRSPDGTQPAFDKHFEDLERAYGAVHVINLLSASKPGEAELSALYRNGIRHSHLNQLGGKESRDHALLRATDYDFHAETKGPTGYEAAREIRRYLEHSADGFAYYLAEDMDDAGQGLDPPQRRSVVVLQQEGVFRTNCLDCLDRTNLIQTILSQMAVESFLGHRGETATPDFWMRHSSLWADNGDALSRIYAGTGALKSSFTRHGKMSLAGAIADARKSATRLYINNFTDKARQNTIDLLLGRLVGQIPVVVYDPISDYVNAELQKRSGQFSSIEKINIWVGTFNLNGRTVGLEEDLSPWLCPPELGDRQPEIVAVGFQEIVELSPQQIMNSDPTRKQLWERAVKKTLEKHAEKVNGERYVLLRSGQLVGAALCIFVRASVLRHIKNVEGSVKKTGLSGMAGNKGAVAIRFDYANTPICFVTAHLAAGFANYEERNRDYATIYDGLRFQRNRRIDDHDSVVWFGDFNYRIGLSLEKTKELVRQGDLEKLYENDQLNLQMVAGLAFRFYSEARINFLPTYKFDVGTDEYDTSEKARIPAWTDRILRKGANLRQLCYNSAPLRFSDHRPVYATFECSVNIVDAQLRDKISREIYLRRKAEIGDGAANVRTEDTDDEDLIGYDSIEPGLPPASSDRQKWWLENGKMARSTVTAPKAMSSSQQTILNPKRPSNPFLPTEEPDWVDVSRSESRLSSFSSMSTSPYEHITNSTDLSTSTPGKALRSIPPSQEHAGYARVVKHDIGSRLDRDKAEAPPPPPPRKQTGTTNDSLPGTAPPMPIRRANPMPSVPDAGRGFAISETTRPVSVASIKSTKSRTGPPVAKKPAHLASPIAPAKPASLSGTGLMNTPPNSSLGGGAPQLPRRPSSAAEGISNPGSFSGPTGDTKRTVSTIPTGPPHSLPSTRTATPPAPPALGAASGTLNVKLQGQAAFEGKSRRQNPSEDLRPLLPSRKNFAVADDASSGKSQPRDLLGDDVDVEVRGWEALKPS
ncbi:hypothetical protein VTK73DRAFT_8898 [Phialemonium thermophilum]|uniref:phosphoinositide 5-phosphatase n=1 Tax=Phialemonium thermophilum TaxID=223376 RepID=A0ABR3XM78_9PEZI